jgi:hypothetical protein
VMGSACDGQWPRASGAWPTPEPAANGLCRPGCAGAETALLAASGWHSGMRTAAIIWLARPSVWSNLQTHCHPEGVDNMQNTTAMMMAVNWVRSNYFQRQRACVLAAMDQPVKRAHGASPVRAGILQAHHAPGLIPEQRQPRAQDLHAQRLVGGDRLAQRCSSSSSSSSKTMLTKCTSPVSCCPLVLVDWLRGSGSPHVCKQSLVWIHGSRTNANHTL